MLSNSSLIAGLTFGFSLLVVIGAQNTFLLRQGLLRHHVTVAVVVCTVSDVILISLGVFGLGRVFDGNAGLLDVVKLIGAVFVFAYGALALTRLLRRRNSVPREEVTEASFLTVLLTALAITWLNPYVYLDTVVLLGTVASSHGSRLSFCVGACAASATWFFALGYGARWLRPLFAKTASWSILDAVIAITMFMTGAHLVGGAL